MQKHHGEHTESLNILEDCVLINFSREWPPKRAPEIINGRMITFHINLRNAGVKKGAGVPVSHQLSELLQVMIAYEPPVYFQCR